MCPQQYDTAAARGIVPSADRGLPQSPRVASHRVRAPEQLP